MSTPTAEKQVTVGSLDWVRDQAHRMVRRHDEDWQSWVQEVFPDHVIVEQDGELFRYPYEVNDDQLVLGERESVSLEYVVRAQQATRGGELTGPFVMKDATRRIAYAPVLVPGEEDADGEEVTKDTIERVAHEWMAAYRNIDHDHSLNNLEAVPVESYITPQDLTVKMDGEEVTIPEGSWILATKFTEEDWERVEKGEWAGYSIMGVKRAAMKSTDVALKRTLLQDLGSDWVATHVSVVENPAVPKAKWFALKSATTEKPSLFARMFSTPAVKEGRKISAARLKQLKEAEQQLRSADAVIRSVIAEQEGNDSGDDEKDTKKSSLDPSEVAAVVKAAVQEATRPQGGHGG